MQINDNCCFVRVQFSRNARTYVREWDFSRYIVVKIMNIEDFFFLCPHLFFSHLNVLKNVTVRNTCKLWGTDLLRWLSLFNFCGRTKLRHDFALKLHESRLVPVDERAVPPSFVVTINGMLVWSCKELLLIFMRLRYGIYSVFIAYIIATTSKSVCMCIYIYFFLCKWKQDFFISCASKRQIYIPILISF